AKDRGAIEAMTRKEFPTLSQDGVKVTLDRIYADNIWSTDGMVSEQGYARDMEVVVKTGAFTKSVPYNDVVDMQFVRKALQKRQNEPAEIKRLGAICPCEVFPAASPPTRHRGQVQRSTVCMQAGRFPLTG